MRYEPNEASVQKHLVPPWFHNAKLGIFIHWGLFSVPGWAPVSGNLHEILESGDWEKWFRNNAYAEWYANSLKIDGSPTRDYHREAFGDDVAYEDFVPMFNEAIKAWDPAAWAATFKRAGARYVVLVTKHHDGFLLWPSNHPNPYHQGYQADRDIVGELTGAVQDAGLTMGLYYSGGLDWTFNDTPIRDLQSLFGGVPQTPEYVEYANSHWRELIERYKPLVVWNDIGYPAATNVAELFADYYNALPDGVVNDRFAQRPPSMTVSEEGGTPTPPGTHFDFRTPEYSSYDKTMPYKWEACRGVGFSFGYNQNETDEQHLPVDTLIRLLVDIVSKNGNLLLNVGPMPDGTIPELQMRRLEALGDWLDVNGAAIFDTRPWQVAEGTTAEGIDVRYTQKDQTLYATLLDTPAQSSVTIQGLRLAPDTSIHMLGSTDPLVWEQLDDDVQLVLPESLERSSAHALAITPQPTVAGQAGDMTQ